MEIFRCQEKVSTSVINVIPPLTGAIGHVSTLQGLQLHNYTIFTPIVFQGTNMHEDKVFIIALEENCGVGTTLHMFSREVGCIIIVDPNPFNPNSC